MRPPLGIELSILATQAQIDQQEGINSSFYSTVILQGLASFYPLIFVFL